MAVLTIRNVDEAIKAALRVQAARQGVSMEEEARRILRDALSRSQEQTPLGQRLLRRFADTASAEFTPPARQAPRNPPAWD
jgi:plasmid stability protein